jgi:predicted ATPase
VEESGAVALFVQQASAARPGFALTSDNVEDVVAICRRLDGLPLAILLAAARTRLLSPRALLARLDDSLGLGSRQADLPERQQTLRSTVAWSHDLLPPAPGSVFARLGAFVSGCSLEAAAAVALPGYGEADPAAGLDPLDVLLELVDANLVIVGDGPDGEPRFRMLQIVREYAVDRLGSAPEADAVRDAHAEYFAVLVEEQSSLLRGPSQLRAIDLLDQERDNIRAALEWTLGASGRTRRQRTEWACGSPER